jgi:hypothetical protein
VALEKNEGDYSSVLLTSCSEPYGDAVCSL